MEAIEDDSYGLEFGVYEVYMHSWAGTDQRERTHNVWSFIYVVLLSRFSFSLAQYMLEI